MQNSTQIITTNKPTSNVLQAGCPSCHPTNSVKALKGNITPRTCLPQGSSNFVLDHHHHHHHYYDYYYYYTTVSVCLYISILLQVRLCDPRKNVWRCWCVYEMFTCWVPTAHTSCDMLTVGLESFYNVPSVL